MPFSREGGSLLSASLPDSRRKELQPLPAKGFSTRPGGDALTAGARGP